MFTLLAQLISVLGIGLVMHMENAGNPHTEFQSQNRNSLSAHPDDRGPGGPLPDWHGRSDGPRGMDNHPPDEHRPPPVGPILSAVLCSLLFSTMVAWYFSKPINILRSAFESVADGNLDLKVVPDMGKRRDELADLGRDFDRMVDRLRVLLDGQNRLMHDISHELRSPLARLQVATGLARQQPEKLDTWLERIETETVRMDKLVGEVLTLARLDAGVTNSSRGNLVESIAMAELIADIVSDAQFEAQALGKRFELSGNCAALVRGDAGLLRRAIENVVRNALKHTAAASTVVLEAGIVGKELKLAILDLGPGVPEAELTRIFEPFFRGSGNQQSSDGHGLGLAIAQRILTTFGASISAHNREGGGLCVEICLPFIA